MLKWNDGTPTKNIPLARRGTGLSFLASQYPTVGHVRAARDADLLKVPMVGRATVWALREIVGYTLREDRKNMTDQEENVLLRKLLKSALADLDTIAPDLTGAASVAELLESGRVVAERGAQQIRDGLREAGLRL